MIQSIWKKKCAKKSECHSGDNSYVPVSREPLIPFPASELARFGCEFIEFIERLKDGMRDGRGIVTGDMKTRIMDIFGFLTELSMKDGYVLGAFLVGEWLGARTQLYARLKNASREYRPIPDFDCWKMEEYSMILPGDKNPEVSPYQEDMIISRGLAYFMTDTIPDYERYVQVPWTEMGIWQAFLLWDYSPSLQLRWHGGYRAHTYIFSNDLLNEKVVEQFADDPRLVPQVIIDGNSARVRFAYWRDWSGLVLKEFRCVRDGNGVRFFDDAPSWDEKDKPDYTREVLYKYDCGIRF